ncbi:hypothetical protein F4861DRAFT_527577 [Xylaria intraflava]|nr:hypothetical protein F4861DRAFT_527577 [Xylaria intraflava]
MARSCPPPRRRSAALHAFILFLFFPFSWGLSAYYMVISRSFSHLMVLGFRGGSHSVTRTQEYSPARITNLFRPETAAPPRPADKIYPALEISRQDSEVYVCDTTPTACRMLRTGFSGP